MRGDQGIEHALPFRSLALRLRVQRRLKCDQKTFRDFEVLQITRVVEGNHDLVGDGASASTAARSRYRWIIKPQEGVEIGDGVR